jgi:hypothetical protein
MFSDLLSYSHPLHKRPRAVNVKRKTEKKSHKKGKGKKRK